MHSATKLETFAKKLLHQLELQPPFDAFEFKDRLAQYNASKIVLCPTKLPSGEYFGFWTQYDETHYIYYREDTRGLHQQQIIFHELAHMLLGHPSADYAKVLNRTSLYNEEQETEAEVFGNILLTNGVGAVPETGKVNFPKTTSSPDGEKMEQFIGELWSEKEGLK